MLTVGAGVLAFVLLGAFVGLLVLMLRSSAIARSRGYRARESPILRWVSYILGNTPSRRPPRE